MRTIPETTRVRPATTVVTAAMSPKIPPFVGDSPREPAATTTATRAWRHLRTAIPSGLFLATTALVVAWDTKLPKVQGD